MQIHSANNRSPQRGDKNFELRTSRYLYFMRCLFDFNGTAVRRNSILSMANKSNLSNA